MTNIYGALLSAMISGSQIAVETIIESLKDEPSGIAGLDENGKIKPEQLPDSIGGASLSSISGGE